MAYDYHARTAMESERQAKAYAMQQNAQNIAAQNIPSTGSAQINDPASARGQLAAFQQLVERLASQRARLRDIADFIFGEDAPSAIAQNGLPSAGGITAEIIGTFAHAGDLLNDIDRQIERLQRVAA